jgi:hypothetical protein
MINEVAVALEVLLVDSRVSDGLEEPLEFRDAYDVAGRRLFRLRGSYHGGDLPWRDIAVSRPNLK